MRECPAPRSAYGFSKLAGEVYCRALHDEHGLPYTICRPFNAYGPGELPDDEPGIAHAVPDLIRKVLSGQQPLEIFGSGEQTRTLTHVDDIADGIVTAMAHPAGRERGLQHLGVGGADGRRDRADHLGGVRARPGRVRARAPAELRGRRAAALAVGREGGAAARLGGADRPRDGHRRHRALAARADRRWLADGRQAGAHHRHHRPGRLLPGGVPAREGLRGARHGPALLDRDLPAAGRLPRRRRAPHRRPPRPALAGRRAARVRAGRDLQPRRDVVRGGLVVPAGPDRRVHRRWASRASSRRCARSRPRRASTRRPPRRCSARCCEVPADRDDALLPALALRRGEVLRPLHHGELPRVATGCSPASGILFNHESRAPRARVRHAQGHARRRPRSSSACRRSSRSGTSTRSGTGAMPRTTSRRCG